MLPYNNLKVFNGVSLCVDRYLALFIFFIFFVAAKDLDLRFREDVLHKDVLLKYDSEAEIATIPYILEHTSPSFLKDYGPLFDRERTEKCFEGHNVVLLGDSLTNEFVFDIAILLSGIGKNNKQLDSFIVKGTSMCAGLKGCEKDYDFYDIHLPVALTCYPTPDTI